MGENKNFRKNHDQVKNRFDEAKRSAKKVGFSNEQIDEIIQLSNDKCMIKNLRRAILMAEIGRKGIKHIISVFLLSKDKPDEFCEFLTFTSTYPDICQKIVDACEDLSPNCIEFVAEGYPKPAGFDRFTTLISEYPALFSQTLETYNQHLNLQQSRIV